MGLGWGHIYPPSSCLMRRVAGGNNYNQITKKLPDWGCFSKLSIKVDQNYVGKPECVFSMCLSSACVPSCPSPSSVSRSKRLAFELLWKWSMPYGQSRCGLTWFGFNTSPQEVHKASRSSFVMLVIFLRGPVEPFAVFIHLLPYRLLYPLDRPDILAAARCHVNLYPVTKWTTLCVFFPSKFCIVNRHLLFYCSHYPAQLYSLCIFRFFRLHGQDNIISKLLQIIKGLNHVVRGILCHWFTQHHDV